jgi:hypothetical protein
VRVDKGEPSRLPNYLVDHPVESSVRSRDLHGQSNRSRSVVVAIVVTAVVAGLIGSAITYLLADPAQSRSVGSATTPAAPPSTVARNLVTRVNQPTSFDGWILTVKQYSVVDTLKSFRSVPSRKWLVVDSRLTNSTNGQRSFTPDMIEARTLGTSREATYESAIPGEVEEPPPGETVASRFVFSVPESSHVFALVIRRDLLAGKARGDAAEIDLNCC